MLKQFNNGVTLAFTLIAFSITVVLIGCKKSEIESPLTKDQSLIKEQFSNSSLAGQIDLNTVKSADNGNKKLFVITANIIGSSTKKVVLKVDERVTDQVSYERFIYETNMPVELKEKDYNSFNGYANFYSLDNSHTNVKVTFSQGSVLLGDNTVSTTVKANSVTAIQYSPLTDCITRLMRSMSFGEWVIFVATEPESVAGLVLACAINVALEKN